MRKQNTSRPHEHHNRPLIYKKYINYLSSFFVALLIIIPLVTLLLPDVKFSATENRILTQLPRFSIDSVVDGRYMKKVETYAADQLVGRNFWIHAKTDADRIEGKNLSNGVYLGKDHTLLENFNPLASADVEKTKTALNNFVTKHPELKHYFMLVPTAINIYSDKLPANAPVLNQNDYIDSFTSSLNENTVILDPRPILEESKDQLLYYKTDHHWTTLGAWLSFQGVSKSMGITPDLDAYTVYPVTNSFSGALVSESGYSIKDTDTIDVYIPKNDNDYSVVTYVEEQKKSPSLYASDQLTGKDKYAVFLDGNHPIVTIKNPVNNGKHLLVLKDSYANAFIPFLTPFYSEITIVDPRYYYDSIETLIANANITDVLYLYNANTFFRDTSLEPVLNDI